MTKCRHGGLSLLTLQKIIRSKFTRSYDFRIATGPFKQRSELFVRRRTNMQSIAKPIGLLVSQTLSWDAAARARRLKIARALWKSGYASSCALCTTVLELSDRTTYIDCLALSKNVHRARATASTIRPIWPPSGRS